MRTTVSMSVYKHPPKWALPSHESHFFYLIKIPSHLDHEEVLCTEQPYHVYSSRMQAKIAILAFLQFSDKGRQSLTLRYLPKDVPKC